MQNKVTIEGIVEKIKGEHYIVMPDGRTTICQLTMMNGFTVNGTSACVDPATFDLNVGRKIAFEDAMRQIWPLEGYLLSERRFWDAMPVVSNPVEPKLIKPPKKAPYGLKKDGTPKAKPGRKIVK